MFKVDRELMIKLMKEKIEQGYKAIEERALNVEFSRPKPFENPQTEQMFKVRFDDIDINNHVNNAVYPLWASESVGAKWRESHTPKRIELWFKKEALYGQSVCVLTKFDENRSLHSITDDKKENELARCEFEWREVNS